MLKSLSQSRIRSEPTRAALVTFLLIAGPVALATPKPPVPRASPSGRPTPGAAVPRRPFARMLKPSPATQVLMPHARRSPPPEPSSSFKLAQSGSTLSIHFEARDRKLDLDPKGKFLIDLKTDGRLILEPSVITPREWPGGQGSFTIKYRNRKAGQAYAIVGKAIYSVCLKNTRNCKRARSNVYFEFKP